MGAFVAVGVAVAAGVVAASSDRVIGEPVRYGAWWDIAVGQYSDRAEVHAGVDQLAGNAAGTDVLIRPERASAVTVGALPQSSDWEDLLPALVRASG